MKILVIRNDRLGDFMLAWPALATLKAGLPDAEIWALVPEYTREIAELCPSIDRVLLDEGNALTLARRMRSERFDALIALYSTTRVGLAGMLGRVPYRLAPATKAAQFLYTHRVRQRRSESAKPEWAYNVDLAKHFLREQNVDLAVSTEPPYLSFSENTRADVDQAFRAKHEISPKAKLVFVHPGSGGSARNLTVEQFASLVEALEPAAGIAVVVTAGPDELAQAEALAARIERYRTVLYHSVEGLRRFAEHLNLAEVFISGSTGPLHVAGALDRPTAAFYTRRKSATALRWQTLNRPERRLAFEPPEDAAPEDMGSIDVEAAAKEISRRFLGA